MLLLERQTRTGRRAGYRMKCFIRRTTSGHTRISLGDGASSEDQLAELRPCHLVIATNQTASRSFSPIRNTTSHDVRHVCVSPGDGAPWIGRSAQPQTRTSRGHGGYPRPVVGISAQGCWLVPGRSHKPKRLLDVGVSASPTDAKPVSRVEQSGMMGNQPP